ncbi:MAG TPA: hypothetical protein VNL73_03420 [Verrucomicrobiae bacterium]|nr:hypothetical protein [Verrucomicrobiae bacterium]
MNFLEQLAAEWYEYKGYFVRTNIKFGPLRGGGYAGEMDVVGYKPEAQELIHIETSADSYSWARRKRNFERKFTDARKYYMEIFPFKQMSMKPRQIALVGLNLNPCPEVNSWKSSAPSGSPWEGIGIEVLHIPEFLRQINSELRNKNPRNDVIPETYPLLRAIQHSAFYDRNR